MSNNEKKFLEQSRTKGFDLSHRAKINFNIGKYNTSVPQGKTQFEDLHLARERAKNIKWRAIETLGQMLEDAEMHLSRRGVKVLWAETGEQAAQLVLDICKEKNCTTLVKSKSMVTEEIHLNDVLEKNGIVSVETDLGEYIQQLDGEPPYHIVTPAMHKSKEDVARVFAEKLGTAPDLTPEQLTLVARHKLRTKYIEAQVGVTGANFIIADTGAIAITENEGNARLCSAFPKTHIVVAGIEKVIPSLTDLHLFWPLLSTFGTGQKLTVYNSIITGPKQTGETDGPESMYVILLDNGRTKILKDPVARESLYCIRCGACLNACPVYKNIGGHTYATTYSGPIGAVVTQHMRGIKDWKHLSYASSLCGNCTEVCAVKINLHELLLDNRNKTVIAGEVSIKENISWKLWRKAMLNRKMMNMGNGKLKGRVVNMLFGGWAKNHTKLEFPEKTFNEMWKEEEKK
jgi:L-lactate dehydrogenase complex protein LldF